MRKIFRHKYILRILAFLALALPVIDILAWKIQEHRLRESAFSVSHSSSPNLLSIIVLLALFFSLISTKRIILSFLFVFLYCVQGISIGFILTKLQRGGYSFPYPENFYFECFISICLLPLSFWLAFSICRFCGQRFGNKTLLK